MQEDNAKTVETKFKNIRKAFFKGKTRDPAWRKEQLRQLRIGIDSEAENIAEALMKDLKREKFMCDFLELDTVRGDISHSIAKLEQWMKPEKVDTPLTIAPAKSRIVYQPLGAVCIIGAWNFPFFTTLLPLISAISAGNTALIKPSELSPNCSASLRKVIEGYLDPECYQVVEGGVEVSITCTQLKWDLICFTGGSEKGKLIAQAAAKNLTPVLLELGGKNVTIVDESANLNVAATKIIGGRFINSGQVCISPEYVMIHESKKDEFVDILLKGIKDGYGDDPQNNTFYSRMINEFHTQRVLDLCKGHGGKVLLGGTGDVKDKYVAPTVIDNPKLDSKLMTEEIFGPVLSILTFKDIEEVYEHMAEREKPLALYYFGKVNDNPNKETLEKHFQAGGMVINDCLVQAVNPDLGFGGVGYSGQGKHQGRHGFINFSNAKSVVVKPAIDINAINKLILPPYSEADKKQIKMLVNLGLYQSQVQRLLVIIAAVFVLFFVYKMGLLF